VKISPVTPSRTKPESGVHLTLMGPKAKVATIFLLMGILGLSVWQFTGPPTLPAVGTKYLNSTYSARGSWTVQAELSAGKAFLAVSIANLTYPRPSLSTTYSLVLSIINQTVTSSYVRSFGIRITGLTIVDNYGGNVTRWGKSNNLTDAVEATSLFFFKTSADHQLRSTVTYQVFDLMFFGYTSDRARTESFNITQTIV